LCTSTLNPSFGGGGGPPSSALEAMDALLFLAGIVAEVTVEIYVGLEGRWSSCSAIKRGLLKTPGAGATVWGGVTRVQRDAFGSA